MKARLTQEMSLNTMVRKMNLGEVFRTTENRLGQFIFHGEFRQAFVDLVAMKIPLPAIYVLEDEHGHYCALNEFANDFLTSLNAYITMNDDERYLVRRACETSVDVIIIRCNNSSEKVDHVLDILKTLKVVA